MGGKEGADMGTGVEGEGSGKERVAMCGSSLSTKKLRVSPPDVLTIEREEEDGGSLEPPIEGNEELKPS